MRQAGHRHRLVADQPPRQARDQVGHAIDLQLLVERDVAPGQQLQAAGVEQQPNHTDKNRRGSQRHRMPQCGGVHQRQRLQGQWRCPGHVLWKRAQQPARGSQVRRCVPEPGHHGVKSQQPEPKHHRQHRGFATAPRRCQQGHAEQQGRQPMCQCVSLQQRDAKRNIAGHADPAHDEQPTGARQKAGHHRKRQIAHQPAELEDAQQKVHHAHGQAAADQQHHHGREQSARGCATGEARGDRGGRHRQDHPRRVLRHGHRAAIGAEQGDRGHQ